MPTIVFWAGEQHAARPKRVFAQNGRLGVDLRSANAHYALGEAYASPMPEVVVCVGFGLGLGLGLGFEKFENINHCLRTYFKVPSTEYRYLDLGRVSQSQVLLPRRTVCSKSTPHCLLL